MKNYVYLPMPVSTEEKREWNKKGFRVLDERFKPEDVETEQVQQDKPKRGRGSK